MFSYVIGHVMLTLMLVVALVLLLLGDSGLGVIGHLAIVVALLVVLWLTGILVPPPPHRIGWLVLAPGYGAG